MRLRNLLIGSATGGILGFAAARALLRPLVGDGPSASAPTAPLETRRVQRAGDGSQLVSVGGGEKTVARGVTLAYAPFRIAAGLVTNAQFRAFTRACGDPTDGGWLAVAAEAGDEAPVAYIRWSDAQAYADWAGLRLPSELEWRAANDRGVLVPGATFPWEWTSTWYDRYPGTYADDRHFGTEYRVILRTSEPTRNFYRPDASACDVGFRCAADEA